MAKTMYGLLIKCIFLLHVFGHTRAQISTVFWIFWEKDFGPVIHVFCNSSTSVYPRWVLANKVLAQGEKLIDADPTRYNVLVGYINLYHGYEYGSLLLIQNAIKEDAGLSATELQ